MTEEALKEIEALTPLVGFGRNDEITITNQNYSLQYYARTLPYVMFGEDNLYMEKVLDVSTKNYTFYRIANDYVAMILNGGYELQTGNASSFLQSLSASKLIERLAWDLIILNGMAVEVVNYPGLNPQKLKTVELIHTPFASVRFSKLNTYNNPKMYYTALDWSAINFNGEVRYYVYDYKELYEVKKHLPYSKQYHKSMYVDYVYHPSSRYYPVADSECIFSQMLVQGKAVEFHVSYLKNGIIGSVMISVPARPLASKEEREKFEQEITKTVQQKFMGARNAGVPLVHVAYQDVNGDVKYPELKGFPQENNDKRNIDLMRIVDEHAKFGMGYLGFDNAQNLGDGTALIVAYNLMYYNRVLRCVQKIEQFFNTIIKNNNIADTLKIPFVLPELPKKEFNQTSTSTVITQ